MADAAAPVLDARHVSKFFGGTRALDDVDLVVDGGSVHGLVGHNGSGKSTLIKVLSGFHVPAPGATLRIDGRPIDLPIAPAAFRALGMAFVHQDPALIPSLSVVENLRIGAIASRTLRPISWRRETTRAAALLAEFAIPCDPSQPVEQLPPWQRPLLAIVRAVDEMRILQGKAGRGLLVLDEPTARLAEGSTEQLFAVIRRVRDDGWGVVFVSHDLDEIMEITDTLTVLRDGRVVGAGPTASFTRDAVIRLIVGHPTTPRVNAPDAPDAPRLPARAEGRAITLRGLARRGLGPIDLRLGRGEIVGATGLAGSGFAELGPMLIGALPATQGWLTIDEREITLTRLTPPAAIAAGIAYVPGDRLAEGCIGELTVGENIAVSVLGRFFRHARLDGRSERTHVRAILERFRVRPADPTLALQALSGGNQQKVLLGARLQLAPKLLVLQEPTAGVDVGAREQIFAIIRSFAADGGSVLCLSDDHEQLGLLADRVLVFHRGRIGRTLAGTEVTKERITHACFDAAATCA